MQSEELTKKQATIIILYVLKAMSLIKKYIKKVLTKKYQNDTITNS